MGKSDKPNPNSLLKRERERRNWTQAFVAEKVGVEPDTVSRWERGTKSPSLYARQKLCELFGKSAVELGLIPDQAEDGNQQINRPLHQGELPFPPIWNVPYDQNPVFTGREHVLQQLHASLITSEAAALTQAISGLGGIGKTQVAVEYCYRHRGEYQAVLWAAADSRDAFLSELIGIAKLLRLPESRAKDQQPVLNALRKWMRDQPHWLLVLDNIESIDMIRDIVPSARRGHLLLTTRNQATGAFPKINVQDMEAEEGALLLLRRASMIRNEADINTIAVAEHDTAMHISRTLGGLPLALDQAGAYIQETGCSLSDYLAQYNVRRAELLRYRGESSSDYPHSVATTWSLSFERIENASKPAANLLRACAFLHPDAIPEEFFTRGARELGPAFQPLVDNAVSIDQVVGEILKYSLIRRNTHKKTLAIHRLVQAVLLDTMDKETQQSWAERLVKAVNNTFLYDEMFVEPSQQRYLLQAQVCMKLVDKWNCAFIEAAQLVASTAKYLHADGYYSQAESYCLRAMNMFDRLQGTNPIDNYRCLTILVLIKADSGDFVEAEYLCENLRVLSKEHFGSEHPFTALSQLYLAHIYIKRGKFEQAEPLVTSALAISESTSLPRGYPFSDILLSLAIVYSHQNRATRAETLYHRALLAAEQNFGAEHSKIADILTEMAIHYSSQHEVGKEEQLRKRALEIYRKTLPPDHPDIAIALTGVYLFYFFQGQYPKAEDYYEQALAIWKRKFLTIFARNPDGENWPSSISFEQGKGGDIQGLLFPEEVMGEEQAKETVTTSIRLADTFLVQGKHAEAEALFWNALHISEKTLGKEDLVTVYCLGDLAKFYQAQKQFVFAEFLYERALQLSGVKFKFVPAGTKQIAENYLLFLKETGREHHATELQRHFDVLKNL